MLNDINKLMRTMHWTYRLRLLKRVKWEKDLYKYAALKWLKKKYKEQSNLFAHWLLVNPNSLHTFM